MRLPARAAQAEQRGIRLEAVPGDVLLTLWATARGSSVCSITCSITLAFTLAMAGA
jgi:hypothetical protein